MKYHIYHFHVTQVDDDTVEACVNFAVEAGKPFVEVQALAEATAKAVHTNERSTPEVKAAALAGKFIVQCANPDAPGEYEASPEEMKISAMLTRMFTRQIMFVEGDDPNDFGARYDEPAKPLFEFEGAEAEAEPILDLTHYLRSKQPLLN